MPYAFQISERSKMMARIPAKNNKRTELALLDQLRALKITGWRRHYRTTGKPDFAFPKKRVAVFLDGCFWHSCPIHGNIPTANQSYWLPKLKRNRMRDEQVTADLKSRGWIVLRIWEHDLRKSRLSSTLDLLAKTISSKK